MNATLLITNVFKYDINAIEFDFDFPENTTILSWTYLSEVSGNHIKYSGTIAQENDLMLYFQISFPPGYEITNYLDPTITNIIIK